MAFDVTARTSKSAGKPLINLELGQTIKSFEIWLQSRFLLQLKNRPVVNIKKPFAILKKVLTTTTTLTVVVLVKLRKTKKTI